MAIITTSLQKNLENGTLKFDYIDKDELIKVLRHFYEVKFDRTAEDKELFKKSVRDFLDAVLDNLDNLLAKSAEINKEEAENIDADENLKLMKEIMYWEGVRDELIRHFIETTGGYSFYYYAFAEYYKKMENENYEIGM